MKNNNQTIITSSCNKALSESTSQKISELKTRLLAEKISIAMKEKRYNRQQFAQVMEVHPSIITRWLSGDHNFTVETLFEIEEHLDIQLIAIDKPVCKHISFHMIVGSEKPQEINKSIVGRLSDLSKITNDKSYSTNLEIPNVKRTSHQDEIEILQKFYTK